MRPNLSRPAHTRLAIFVGGGPEALPVVESVLDGQSYEVEFVASDDEPYATIALLQPDLVVVSLGLDDLSGFQLLSMLRLDATTAGIPVLSYVKDDEVTGLGMSSVDLNPMRLSNATHVATKVPN
jgi:DNA-binding response OmpR family regulator